MASLSLRCGCMVVHVWLLSR